MIGGFSKSHRDAGLGTARRSRRRRVVVGQRDGVRGAKRVGWADGPRTGLGLGVPGLRMLGRPFDVAILRAALDLAPNETRSGRAALELGGAGLGLGRPRDGQRRDGRCRARLARIRVEGP